METHQLAFVGKELDKTDQLKIAQAKLVYRIASVLRLFLAVSSGSISSKEPTSFTKRTSRSSSSLK